jgi:hypothetical protein
MTELDSGRWKRTATKSVRSIIPDFLSLDKREIIGYSIEATLGASRPHEGREGWLAAVRPSLRRAKDRYDSDFYERSGNVYENKGTHRNSGYKSRMLAPRGADLQVSRQKVEQMPT